MFPRSLLLRQTKRRKVIRSESSSCSISPPPSTSTPWKNFMSKRISDDLLFEIFLRLSDSSEAVRCRTVCKRWDSLLSAANFVSSFISHRRYRSFHDSHTLITSLTFRFRFSLATCIFSDAALWVRGQEVSVNRADLGFMPSEDVLIESSSEDLLALSAADSSFYICNIFTRQWLRLPNLPYKNTRGPCAIVCEPNRTNEIGHIISYRILQIGYVKVRRFGRVQTVCHMSIFSSETGRWGPPTDGPILVPGMDMVSGNGLLFWIDNELKRVFTLNPFRSPDDPKFYSYFELPWDIVSEDTQYRGLPLDVAPWKALRFGSSKARLRIGLVSGQLRLAQVFRARGVGFVLKVWELNFGGNCWGLVHEGKLKAEVGTSWMFFLSFHPEDGDVVFLLRDEDIYSYEIGTDRYEKVGKFFSTENYKGVGKNMVPVMLKVHPLRKPIWPSPSHLLPLPFRWTQPEIKRLIYVD